MAKEPENVVLICNPKAGGHWKQLAGILDSAEAQHVRRIVTDDIDDIRPALTSLSKRVKLVCLYGGDGTIQKILTNMFHTRGDEPPPIALIGGGTMNVTARWAGWKESPEKNFRRVVGDYLADKLVTRDVPLLEVRQGSHLEYGFTFGNGTIIRIVNEYENGGKGKLSAVLVAVKAIAATWTRQPIDFLPVLEQMRAEIIVDGELLPYDRYIVSFCNITGDVLVGVHPFTQERQREAFNMLAYSIDSREVSILFPFLFAGKIPIDPKSLLKPVSTWTQIGLSFFTKGSLPLDPRYVNRTAREVEYRTKDPVYTVDGEIFQSTGEPIVVKMGPTLRLAISA